MGLGFRVQGETLLWADPPRNGFGIKVQGLEFTHALLRAVYTRAAWGGRARRMAPPLAWGGGEALRGWWEGQALPVRCEGEPSCSLAYRYTVERRLTTT